MALAPFFSKAALSASQVLSGVSQVEFVRRVNGAAVSVALAENASNSAEGRVTLELLVNLLSRLLPSFELRALDGPAQAFLPTLETLARSINPAIDLAVFPEPSMVVVVGKIAAPPTGAIVFAGSDAWTACLSRQAPRHCGNSDVPFGAAAAACLASANIFRSIFGDALVEAPLDNEVEFSLWNYDGVQTPPPTGPFSLGEVHLAGAGAIGNGLLWTLARLRGTSGILQVVDPEKVELGNLQRYVLTTMDSPTQWKTEIAEKLFADSSLVVKSHPVTWGRYLADKGDYRIDTVAVALDSRRARIDVQGALPRRIFNAWTQRENLGVSRHLDFLNEPCLACIYLPDGSVPNEDEEIARSLKMVGPAALMEIRVLLHSGAPLSPEFVGRVAALAEVDPTFLAEFIGQPLRSLYSGAVCGGLLLNLSGVSAEAAEVPMPFQSALAGVMLAAELVAASFVSSRPTTTTLNLLRPIPPYLSFSREKPATCICADAVFRRVYEGKWGGGRNLPADSNEKILEAVAHQPKE